MNQPILDPDHALRVSEELFRGMLPESEGEFRRELRVWHPELDARRYMVSHSYPRCWIVTAALIFASAFTEYGRLLLDTLRQRPDIVREVDVRVAEASGRELLSLLDEAPWRKAICATGSHLYFFSPQTLTRAFGVGLNFAFVQPEATHAFVEIVRSTATATHDRQVAAAEAVIRRHPVSGHAG